MGMPQDANTKQFCVEERDDTSESRYCSSDSRRSNIARGKKANKQISLANQGLTRSFHWSRAIS